MKSLDRLGRNYDEMTKQLDIITREKGAMNHQRTMEGLAAARARGVRFCRKPMEKPEGYEATRARWAAKELSARKAAELLGVSPPTFLKWVKEPAHE